MIKNYDGTDLIEFFGVLPDEEVPEEQEFFSSISFTIVQDRFKFRISFSSTHTPFIIYELVDLKSKYQIVMSEIQEFHSIRLEGNPKSLNVIEYQPETKPPSTKVEGFGVRINPS